MYKRLCKTRENEGNFNLQMTMPQQFSQVLLAVANLCYCTPRGTLNRTSIYFLLCVTASWQGAFRVFYIQTRLLLAFSS